MPDLAVSPVPVNTLQRQTQRAATGYTVAEVVERQRRFVAAFPTAEQFAQRLMRSVLVRSS